MTESGEQIPLMDTLPEGSEEIIACAKRYKNAQAARIEALNMEKQEKGTLLELIEKAGFQRLEDGKIKFTADGFTITVTPRDELVQVKEADEVKE
jgi:hypothetical protein